MNNAPTLVIDSDITLRKPDISDIETRLSYGRPRYFRKMFGGSLKNNPPFTYKFRCRYRGISTVCTIVDSERYRKRYPNDLGK